MSSSEFRKRFARLTEATEVRANGHLIGVWLPQGSAIAPFASQPHTPEREAEIAARHPERFASRSDEIVQRHPAFREFRPVPKPSQKGK